MNVSRDILRERVNGISRELGLCLETVPALPSRAEEVLSWDVVGVGGSEGPARLFVSAWQELGGLARYVPISSFVSRPHMHKKRGLLVFSQGLSPNAQLALRHAPNYHSAAVVTSVTEESRPDRARALRGFPGVIWRHGPREEGGALVRLSGPVCASLRGLQLCLALAPASEEKENWQAAMAQLPLLYASGLNAPLGSRIENLRACLSIGSDISFAGALMWKWQEALYVELPPALDVLAFAHGPLQSLYKKKGELLLLERETGPVHDDLYHRLERVLPPGVHRLVRLRAKMRGPLAFFEYDAAMTALLLRELEARRIDPGDWPGKGLDGALYSLGEKWES